MKEDIFDRILDLPFLKRFKPYRGQLLYVFFGGVTTVVNIGSFWLLSVLLGGHELLSNIGAWIVTMCVVYITNRLWVFQSTAHGFREVLKEIGRFLYGRLLTLALEEFLLFLFISQLRLPSMPVKILTQILVIVTNYFISRHIIFRKPKEMPVDRAGGAEVGR